MVHLSTTAVHLVTCPLVADLEQLKQTAVLIGMLLLLC